MHQNWKTTLILAVIVLLVMLACGYIGYTNSLRPAMPPVSIAKMIAATPTVTKPARELGFCYENVTSLCLASFGRDNAKHLLIIFKNHKPVSANFYVNIKRANQSELYKCQPVPVSPGTAYCMGKNVPEGADVTIEVYSNTHRLLASGVMPISAGATPTEAPTNTPTPTSTITPTFVPGQPTATVVLSTPTPSNLTPSNPTPQPTAPATLTPSYPYP